MKGVDRTLFEKGYGSRFYRFQDLMRHRVHNILIVSSLYDSFILEEDGRFDERLIMEYAELNLVHMPRITRASTGKQALEMIKEQEGFDLIIATMHLGDMHAVEFSREIRINASDTPIVLLTYDYRELKDLHKSHSVSDFEKIFLWQGDFRILLAIVKLIEDRMNLDQDTELVGVQSIILIEDNVRFYSSYLPNIYAELMSHSQSVLSEGVNLSHRIMRMRARPKILLCENYEEAWELFNKYHENILGVITDIEFPRNGFKDPRAGIEFTVNVRKKHPDIPILLQSGDPAIKELAKKYDVQFLRKNSRRFISKLRQFMVKHLSFGDFILRMPDGSEVDRVTDLKSLEKKLHTIPDECLVYHANRNHFSTWLKARTEFFLAHKLRPQSVEDYSSVDELRKYLIRALKDFRTKQQRGIIVDFDSNTFDESSSFARIGGGSLGGKGRGLAFFGTLIDMYDISEKYPGIHVSVPPAIVLGTNVFDRFMEQDNLLDFALQCDDENAIKEKFIETPMPHDIVNQLSAVLDLMKYPLAVRSSSLLEDSQHQPFAGVYLTCMLPNSHEMKQIRLEELQKAIKLVYASTFSKSAKGYIQATPYRLEEEKMAVIIQKLVGSHHFDRFYPDFAGVARSYNFYPIPPMNGEDGIASVALGLGATVVEGGATIRFCPSFPKHLVQFSSVEDTLKFSQKEYYALEISSNHGLTNYEHESAIEKFDLATAEVDNTLGFVGSTYSIENHAIYDGLSRKGARIVSFAPILKNNIFPLSEILKDMLELGKNSMSAAVEIEFAANLSVPKGELKEFQVVQMRPMVIRSEWEQVSTEGLNRKDLICESRQIMGNGIYNDIRHIVVVDYDKFERANTQRIAQEIGVINHQLLSNDIPYILIGLGRWGSSDPWLGIPVKWDQISGARVIVEAGFKDMKVTPSQGTHFFQNLASMEIGYFTIDSERDGGFVDWDWIGQQITEKHYRYTRLIKFQNPVEVKMNGRNNHGLIVKPEQADFKLIDSSS